MGYEGEAQIDIRDRKGRVGARINEMDWQVLAATDRGGG